ncbi:MAG: hypothetical protein KC468_33940 [Myxococcales bacterium]|nr:hypothetical protein [Myxococcales bacterium]
MIEGDGEGDGRADACYPGGVPNPRRLGFLDPAMGGGGGPPEAAIEAVARRLGRPRYFEDEDGYEHELVAAALDPAAERLAWVESRCQERRGWVDVDFTIVAVCDGVERYRGPVQSYNPYFGCDVRYMAWRGDRLVLIYREKHDTYAFRLRCGGAPDDGGARSDAARVWGDDGDFFEIEDDWLIVGEQLVFFPYRLDVARALSLRERGPARELSIAQARAEGLLPADFDALASARAR